MKWKRSKKAVTEAKQKAENKKNDKEGNKQSNNNNQSDIDNVDVTSVTQCEEDDSDLDLDLDPDCENDDEDDDSADMIDVGGRMSDITANLNTNVNLKAPLVDQSNLQCDIPTDLSMRPPNQTTVHETLVR